MKLQNLDLMDLNEIDNALNEIDNQKNIVNFTEKIKKNPAKSFGKLLKTTGKRQR